MKYDFLIVGAGFAGSVCAQQLAEAGKTVLVIDKRPHIGGNAYDVRDKHGVLIHPYGPHIFHTNAARVFEYLSRFTAWRFYEHRVLAHVEKKLVPIPINRITLNMVYGMELDEAGAIAFLEKAREPRDHLKNSEDVVLNSVGRDLCDKFFRGYTRKQWGLDLSELSAGVAARIPTRTNDDDRYFTDTFQYMPDNGYTCMFERMLDHANIEIRLGVDFDEIKNTETYDHIIYTGPIDAFYSYRFGKLPYRSLRFEHQHLPDVAQYQSVGTVNYPNDYDYTRVTDFSHLSGENLSGTSIVREYPTAEGDPYYPIPTVDSDTLFKRYDALAQTERKTTFVGRLAQYRYYNMDQVVAAGLIVAKNLIQK